MKREHYSNLGPFGKLLNQSYLKKLSLIKKETLIETEETIKTEKGTVTFFNTLFSNIF